MPQPADPCSWTRDDVERFAEDAAEPEVAQVLRSLMDADDTRAIQVLVMFLGARNSSTMLKPVPSQLAAVALIGLGSAGVVALKGAILANAKGRADVRYAPDLLEMLWNASLGQSPSPTGGSGRVRDDVLVVAPPSGTREAAESAVRELLAECWVDSDVFYLVSSFMWRLSAKEQFMRRPADGARRLLGMLSEGAIRLSPSLIAEYEELLAAEHAEERYQEFLTAHPVFLDPLAAAVVPKQRLGLELATDFVVRSHDGRWSLVEIERPQDPIFTKGRDFRERFVHGFGQVLDFQSWVDNNVAYAQRLMPGIAAPRGLLVMGMRSTLTFQEADKLRSFAANSPRIDVVAFDDLVGRAKALYRSLWRIAE